MDDRQILLSNLRVTALGDGKVLVPALGEVGIAAPVISNDHRLWHNRSLNEATKRLCATIWWSDGESDSPRISDALPPVELGTRSALAHLYSTGDKYFVMDAPAFTVCSSTDMGLIDLDVLTGLASNPVLIGTHHAGAELVENLESGLVASQPKLPLKLHSRHSTRLAGHHR